MKKDHIPHMASNALGWSKYQYSTPIRGTIRGIILFIFRHDSGYGAIFHMHPRSPTQGVEYGVRRYVHNTPGVEYGALAANRPYSTHLGHVWNMGVFGC